MADFTGGPENNTWSLNYGTISGVFSTRGDGGGGIDTLVLDLSAAPDQVVSGIGDDSEPGGFGPGSAFYGIIFEESVWHRNFERFQITGGASDDDFSGGASDDVLNGNAGSDALDVGGNGNDTVDGGSDRDRVIIDYSAATSGVSGAAAAAGTLDGLQGSFSSGATRTVSFNNIEDITLLTGSGNDTVTTGDGDDVVTVSGGTDLVDGGLGLDRLIVLFGAATGAVTGAIGPGTLDSYQGSFSYGAGHTVNFNNVSDFTVVTGGGAFNDVIVTGAGADRVDVFNGLDVVQAGTGDDFLSVDYGASTTDVIGGASGAGTVDSSQGSFSDGAGRSVTFDNIAGFSVTTGSGNDQITTGGGVADDTVITGGGTDLVTVVDGVDFADGGDGANDRLVIDYSSATDRVANIGAVPGLDDRFQVGFGGVREVRLRNFEHLTVTTGSESDSVRDLSNGNDVISTNGEDDFIEVSGGIDVVDGGSSIFAGFGGDRLTIHYGDSTSNIVTSPITAGTIDGFQGGYSDGAGRTVNFDNIEVISITTGAGNDIITMPGGNDTVSVNGGNDIIDGGVGFNYLSIDYSDATAGMTGGPTGSGTIEHHQGSFSAGSGHSVTFDNIGEFAVNTGSGNDDVTLGRFADFITVSFGNDVINGGANNDSWGDGDTLNVDYHTATSAVVGGPSGIGTLHGHKGSYSDGGSRSVIFDNFDQLNVVTGSGNDNITGGSLNDRISTGDGNDFIDGGAGPDSMAGGHGDDTYFVDHAGDRAESEFTLGFEVQSGFDTVFASASFSLDGSNGVEKLVLTGSDNLDGTGNRLDNILQGNSGTNSLTGLDGDDLFVAMPGMGADRVTDFVAGVDTDDRVDVSAFPALLTLEDVLALATQDGPHTVINFGNGDTLTLENVLRSNLVAEDFGFVGNDAPSGKDRYVFTNEDTAYVFAAADFGFSDLHDVQPSAFAAVRITTLPTAGSLTSNGAAVNAGDFVSVAAINGGLLRFTPAPDGNGLEYASFTFQVQDDGGTANGGVDLDPTPNEMIIDVIAVDDPPPPPAGNPVITNLAGDVALFTESDLFVLLDAGTPANVTDSDTEIFDGGRLTISITANEAPGEDRLRAGSESVVTSPGISYGLVFSSDFSNPRNVVWYNRNPNSYDEIIGRLVSDGSNGSDIVIDLGPDPEATAGTHTTLDEVIALIQAINYVNSNGNDPSALPRTVTFTLTDGNDGSATLTTTVNIQPVNDRPAIAGPSSGVTYENASTSSTGVDGNQTASRSSPNISTNGDFVVFHSNATNLVPNDTNGVADIFVKNLQDGSIERVSVSSAGVEANGASGSIVLSISADGRHVIFRSSASNLVPDDTNNAPDIFLRDTLTDQTTRVSTGSNGEQASAGSNTAFRITNNGQFALFASDAALVPGDAGAPGISQDDLYVKNLVTGEVKLASVNAAGELGLNFVQESNAQRHAFFARADMSDDGRYVVFETDADNMVPNYDQGPRGSLSTDVYLKDMLTGEVMFVSERNSGGASHDDPSITFGGASRPKMSADGRFVVFEANMGDLVANDTTPDRTDVFLWDRDAPAGSKLRLISTNSLGEQANTGAFDPNISPNGRYVVFESHGTNLVSHSVPTGQGENENVYVKDLLTGEVRFVGQTTGGESDKASVTNDGQVIAFPSENNLGPGDTDGRTDVYIARFTGSGSIPVSEDLASPVRGISFEDLDSGNGNVTATFTVPRGTLSATSFGGVAVSGTGTALVLTGTVAAINTFLAQDRLLYTTVLNDTADVALGVAIDDGGNIGQDPGTSPGASSESATRTFTLDVIPVNDPPVVSNNGLTVAEGTGATIAAAMLDANDVDNSDAELSYTIATPTTHGTLFKNGVALGTGGSFTQDDINNLRISYLHDGSDTTSDSFTFTLRDGAEGSVIEQSFGITVIPVVDNDPNANDAPVNTVPGTRELEANVPAAITGLAVVDDSGSGIITTTLSVQYGILTVAAIGGAAVAGSGTDTVTLTGTLVQVNAALAGNNVVYSGPRDFFGADTLTMTTNDNGHTGSGGAKTDTDRIPINLNTYLHGTVGDDSYHALPGNEMIVAVQGIDTVTFDFALVDATVSYRDNLVIIDGPSSHTVLSGLETFVFTDGTVRNGDGDRLVDDLFYYWQNQDVWNANVDADWHYHAIGWTEGRDPNAFFDIGLYLAANQDVKNAGVDPLLHFTTSGWREGRVASPAFDADKYLAFNPDVAAAQRDPLEHFLRHGMEELRLPFPAGGPFAANGFDFSYYLLHNPDVAAAGIDPFWHFQATGWKEGRNPNALFDVAGYLAHYTDVAAAGINPLDHYHQSGWREGRDPSVGFDTVAYLAANPDVAAAGLDPLAHYLQLGIHENRATLGDGIWSG